MNGERFYLLQDESALGQYDETRLFKVGIDGASSPAISTKLLSCFRKRPQRATSTATRIHPTCRSWLSTSRKKRPFPEMGWNRVLRDGGLPRNLDARAFGLPDRLLLQVVSLIQGPLNEQAFIQFANSWASRLRLLTLPYDGEDLRAGVLRTMRKPPALIRLRLQLTAFRLKGG